MRKVRADDMALFHLDRRRLLTLDLKQAKARIKVGGFSGPYG
jgi:hypothetical protein